MPAFFVALIKTVKDAEKFQEYGRRAAESFAPFGGALLARGKLHGAIAGAAPAASAAIVSFPDAEALDQWAGSPAYQALIPLRDDAADLVIAAYDAPVG